MSDPKLHPMILTAAGAVILASGVGIAHWMGWVGNTSTTAASQPVASVVALAATPEPTAIPTLAPTQAPSAAPSQAPTVAPTPKSHKYRPTTRPAVPPAQAKPGVVEPEPTKIVCSSCGRVLSVRQVEKAGGATGGGAVVGGVVGGVVGHQIGNGRGNDVATVLGAIGGAIAGHQVEKQVRKTHEYLVSVRFDDGSERTITYKEQPGVSAGDRVRLRDGQLVQE